MGRHARSTGTAPTTHRRSVARMRHTHAPPSPPFGVRHCAATQLAHCSPQTTRAQPIPHAPLTSSARRSTTTALNERTRPAQRCRIRCPLPCPRTHLSAAACASLVNESRATRSAPASGTGSMAKSQGRRRSKGEVPRRLQPRNHANTRRTNKTRLCGRLRYCNASAV